MMMRFLRQNRKSLYWVAGGLVALTLIGLVTWWLMPHPAKSSSNTTATTSVKSIEECTGKTFVCYNDYLTARTHNQGPAEAIRDVQRVYGTDSYVQSQCHQLTHVIGREAVKKYVTVKEAFEHGDGFCWSGYYHGVVEAAIKNIGADKIKRQTNEICSGFAAQQKYSFTHYNCVHGMGHGFMAVEELNLFKALKDCDFLHDDWERVSCYGGVFMENIMIESRGEGKSAYLKPDQPMYPCTAVDQRYKEQCYLMQTSYVLQQNQYNFGVAFTQCQKLVDKDFIATCYQSIGRDASGSTVSDVTRTKANCDQATNSEGLQNCVLGAVRDFISYFHSDTQAKQFCQAYAESVKTRCDQEIVTYYATFR